MNRVLRCTQEYFTIYDGGQFHGGQKPGTKPTTIGRLLENLPTKAGWEAGPWGWTHIGGTGWETVSVTTLVRRPGPNEHGIPFKFNGIAGEGQYTGWSYPPASETWTQKSTFLLLPTEHTMMGS